MISEPEILMARIDDLESRFKEVERFFPKRSKVSGKRERINSREKYYMQQVVKKTKAGAANSGSRNQL